MSEAVPLPQDESWNGLADEPSFLLTGLEVFNWGPFQGKHRCEIDPGGSAIIGPTGSGKTTLIDALMTLLAPFPRYNLASTGGHESDRDLISYVRGDSDAESAGGENNHVARPGKTVTGLSASYRGNEEYISIGVILWVDGSSRAADELKKLWFVASDIDLPLDHLLQLHHEGGKSALVRYARVTVGLRLFASKKEYLAQVRSFFEVNENAFSLLNRAAGLKQINSIDQIFRELVLDDRSAFARAQEVAVEFDTLQGIYAELETARRQRDSLLPVQALNTELLAIDDKLSRRIRLKDLIPHWFADVSATLWQAEVDQISTSLEEAQRQIHSSESEVSRRQIHVDTLKEKYLHLGGATVLEIEGNIATKQRLTDTIRKSAGVYQGFVRQLRLSDELSERAFRENLALLPQRGAALGEEHTKARDATLETESKLRDAKLEVETLQGQIRDVGARPHSNIPPQFQSFRESLASHLALPPTQLPFVAELVEVKSEEEGWRGAIERAIGSERLRLLVPREAEGKALSWVNRRDNKLHVRLEAVEPSPPPARFFEDGYTRKLNYREHPYREHLKYLLSKRDRHCVASTEILERTEHGMTVEGTLSDRKGRYEKQDQQALSEGWMTGFDNSHQLRSLALRMQGIQSATQGMQEESRTLRGAEETLRQRLVIIEQLQTLEFQEIDLPGAEQDLDLQRQRLAALTMPDSDTARAKLEFENAHAELTLLRDGVGQLREVLGSHKTALLNACEELERAMARRGEALSDEDTALAAKSFSAWKPRTVKDLADAEREANKQIGTKIERAETQKSETEKRLIRAMEGAKREDTGALTDTRTELRDVPEYLQRLQVLQDEALPEKLRRFLDYLNLSSGQGVTQLLAHIDNEVSMIVERVADLNATLSRVDFREGRYLQLAPEKVGHEALRQVETAHKKLCLVALRAEEDQGETHYRALGEVIRLIREAVEGRRTLAAQALLDPRHRLQFYVVEVERSTGHGFGRRTGSQTGSGGEKEMMASYILTASLSYALCPVGATRPRYATIVLDEAFSKSSPAAASRIIEALRIFGLHPVFVTPNKEIALLKVHTRSAILVHNKNKRATLTSLTWQEIEAHERGSSAPR